MRTNARPLSALAAALLLAASAMTLAGCGSASSQNTPPPKVKSQACMGPATTVTVFVQSDGTTNNKIVYVCEGKDSVEWVTADENTYVSDDIQWKTDSPFDEKPKHQTHGKRKHLHSKAPKAGSANHGYDYDAWLILSDGSKKHIDPRIVVMP